MRANRYLSPVERDQEGTVEWKECVSLRTKFPAAEAEQKTVVMVFQMSQWLWLETKTVLHSGQPLSTLIVQLLLS